MSIHEWPDDDLDEVFRKSAQEANVANDPQDWQRLRARLGGHDRTRWMLPAMLFLLVSTGGVIWYRGLSTLETDRPSLKLKQHSGSIASHELVTITPTVTDQSTNRIANHNKRIALPPSYQQTRPAQTQCNAQISIRSRPQVRLINRDSGFVAMERVDGQSVVSITSPTPQAPKADGSSAVVPDLAINQRTSRNANPDASANPDNDSVARFSIQLLTTERASGSLWPNLPPLEPLKTKQVTWPIKSVLLPVINPFETDAPRTSATQPRLSKLSVQVVLSPDLSAIGFHNFDRPGSNVGVLGQFQLSNRFSLQTGALWSTKRYTTLASEYVWPAGAPATALRPESVTGRCTMIDIPLNLRYDIWLRLSGNRLYHRWFVSGGITSYVIDHEAYTYNYANPDDPAIKRTNWDNKVEGRPGGSFGLSAINISVGYERAISQRFSWQIEPFLKVPVRQIGYFNVHLVSTGAFLSLRYRL